MFLCLQKQKHTNILVDDANLPKVGWNNFQIPGNEVYKMLMSFVMASSYIISLGLFQI